MFGWKKMTYENSSGPAGCRQNLPSLGNGERVLTTPSRSQDATRMVVEEVMQPHMVGSVYRT